MKLPRKMKTFFTADDEDKPSEESRQITHSDESEGSVNMIEIPMVVWASSSFRTHYANKWNAMKKSVDKPYMTDDLIHSLLDLMDIKTASYDPRKSIWNDQFDVSRPRIYNDKPYVKQ